MADLSFPKPWFRVRQGRVNIVFELALADAVLKAPARYRRDEYPEPIDFLHHFLLVAHQVAGFTAAYDSQAKTVCLATSDARLEFTRGESVNMLWYSFPAYGVAQSVLVTDAKGYERFKVVISSSPEVLYLHLNRVMEVVHRLRYQFPAKNKRRP